MRKYTFVTVAHHVDYEALCLQARSMAKYLPVELIAEIIVIDNDLRGPPRSHLMRQYGKLAKFVRLIDRREVSAPEVFKAHGWFGQQILKLEIAKLVQTDRYVVLDAKNTMVYPLRRDFLENSKGEPRLFQIDYTRHSSRRWLRNSVAYWGIADPTKWFVPTVTPFTLITDLVKHAMDAAVAKDKVPFHQLFIENHLTEFFFYACYLRKTGQMCYDWSGPECKIVFNTTSCDAFVTSFLQRTQAKHLPFFSLHRGAKLSAKGKALVWRFWRSRGLRSGVPWS